ncbi:MAG: hypothetical protein IKT35_02185, partial [Clostridia bacterium]|nr:hypothetical protein [Clostridia bacterium]
NNGEITAFDALLALRHTVGEITLESNAFVAADVTVQYGVVNSVDALCILQYAVELIDSFDVETVAK